MNSLDFALDTAMQLSQNEREELINILQKRQSLEWRKETAEYYHELKRNINKGDLKPQSIAESINELHNYLNYPE